MKYFNLKFLLLTIIATFGQDLCAQDYEIRTRHKGNGLIAVDARFVGAGIEPQAGTDAFLDFTIDLRWPAAADLNLGNPDNTGNYGIAKAGVETIDGTEEFQGYFMPNTPTFLPITWTQNTWIEIFTIQSNSDGTTGETIVVGALGSNSDNLNIPNFNMSTIDHVPVINGAAILPVELSYFKAKKIDATTAQLSWSTASEQNTSHFNLERSTNARNWEILGKVNAAGDSHESLDYGYADKNIPLEIQHAGIIYYRLNIVDLDGYQEYSNIEAIDFDAKGNDLIVYPNPTSRFLTIGSAVDILSVTVFDHLGKRKVTTGSSRVDLSDFASGVYRVSVETEAGIMVKTVVKLN